MEKNRIIKCEENGDFYYYNDFNPCENEFILDEDKIYFRESVEYFGEPVKQYYTVCPNCGYLVCIDEKTLTEEDKILAEIRSEEYYAFHKNILRGKLIHIDYMEEKEKERIKNKTRTL